MVTTNVFLNGSPIANPFQYKVLSNGMRVLSFAFLYMSHDNYNGAVVLNQTEVIRSQTVQNVFYKYALQTDVVVLNLHIGARS